MSSIFITVVAVIACVWMLGYVIIGTQNMIKKSKNKKENRTRTK